MTLPVVDVQVPSSRLGYDGMGRQLKAPATAKVVDVRGIFHKNTAVDLIAVSPEQAADLEPHDFVVFNTRHGPQTANVFEVKARDEGRHDRDGGDSVWFELTMATDKRTAAVEIAGQNRRTMEQHRELERLGRQADAQRAWERDERIRAQLAPLVESVPAEQRTAVLQALGSLDAENLHHYLTNMLAEVPEPAAAA